MLHKKRDNTKGFFWVIFTFVLVSIAVGIFVFQTVSSCFGPNITASVSATEININETVVITGTTCLGSDVK